eukprot:jgi/Mesvir1/20644/Mv14865-RA.1
MAMASCSFASSVIQEKLIAFGLPRKVNVLSAFATKPSFPKIRTYRYHRLQPVSASIRGKTRAQAKRRNLPAVKGPVSTKRNTALVESAPGTLEDDDDEDEEAPEEVDEGSAGEDFSNGFEPFSNVSLLGDDGKDGLSSDKKKKSKLSEDHSKELRRITRLLPPWVRNKLESHPELENLIEVVLDLGREPIARFPEGDRVGDFGEDNRAGIDRTLHRVSAMRNRRGRIVGLTCRVGRSIAGSASMARDLVQSGNSLLLMGRPGVGKTTAIREIARILADEYGRRVVIVDTSNEIGGDGDIPHPGVGRARRMQVPTPELQHQVMIEAVENHMPQVIVIDEIGTELECLAARTIAQRGVQLVATAHGNTLDNIVKNPSLSDLIGGIQSVTLGDEEARRRGVQKSVLERKSPPTFQCCVEMVETKTWRVHQSVAQTVDLILAGKVPRVEVRTQAEDDAVSVSSCEWTPTLEPVGGRDAPPKIATAPRDYRESSSTSTSTSSSSSGGVGSSSTGLSAAGRASMDAAMLQAGVTPPPLLLFTYSISEEALEQVVEALGLSDAVQITDDISTADAVLALRSRLRATTWVREAVKEHRIPIYAIKANTMAQMVRALRTILGIDPSAGAAFGDGPAAGALRGGLSNGLDRGSHNPYLRGELGQFGSRAEDEIDGLEEARLAIEQIVIPNGTPVELSPRSPRVLSMQAKLAEGYQLSSVVTGKEPDKRLRVLPAYMSAGVEE